MKKVFIVAIITSFALSANAQLGAPKELTCTEEAFNFSVSVGTKWKFSTPKMGPVDITRDDPGYTPSWSLKVSNMASERYSPMLSNELPGIYGLSYSINPQNNIPLFNQEGLKFMEKLRYINPVISYYSPISYPLLKSSFLPNSN